MKARPLDGQDWRRGVALIIVLGFLSVMILMAVAFLTQARVERLVSVSAATLYTSMMAIYYANVVMAQSELKREAQRHQVTAAKMRKAKEEAERASEAWSAATDCWVTQA